MGLLDSVTSAIGLGDNFSDIASNPKVQEIVKKIDPAKIQQAYEHIKKNGIPKDMDAVNKIIAMFK